MNKFQNILFVADNSKGEKAALAKILEMAASNNASVTVVDVVERYADMIYTLEIMPDVTDLYEAMLKQRRAELEDLVRMAARRLGKVNTQVLLLQGIDHIEIIKQVAAGKHDLLAKAANNDAGLAGVLFGTLDMQLLRKCPCPVLIVKPRKKISHARILAAVDLNISSKERIELDNRVVQLAGDMAMMEEGALDMIHAWHLSFEKKLRNEERIRTHQTVDAMLREMRDLEKRNLAKLADQFAGFAPRTHLIKGAPSVVIPRFVRSHRIDLLVMGTVGRSGVSGFFIGNTAEKILNGLSCSVLAIKPRGFKTPVK